MKISVIVPVYNAEQTLRKCVGSLCCGEYKDFEIILIDDGSVDNSLQLCKQLSSSDQRIKVIHQPNRGAAAARNQGIRVATGEYIGFIDSDDTVDSKYLLCLTKYIELYDGPDIIWFNMRYTNENGAELFKSTLPNNGPINQSDYLSCFYGMNVNIGSLCSKLFRAEFLKLNNLTLDEERVYGEDWDFNLRCALLKPHITLVPDVLYNYVKYSNTSTVSTRYYAVDFVIYCNSYSRLISIANEYQLNVSQDDQDSIFIYNVISHLIKLFASDLQSSKKTTEYRTIISNDLFRHVLTKGAWDCRYMSKRQRLVALLLKKGHNRLAKFLLSI